MKILRVLPSMDFGGIERGVYDFSKKAIQLGHEVIIVAGYGRFIPELLKYGVKWYELPIDRKNIRIFLNAKKKLKEIIKKERPDIIHAQSRFPCWIVYSIKKEMPKINFITSIHSVSPFYIYSQSVGKGDLIIVVSEFLKKYAMKKLNVSEDKIRLVYNGISDEFSKIEKIKEDNVRIGIISRFTSSKGHFYFLKTFKKLIEDRYDIKGIIVGSGSKRYKRKIENWIKKNKIEDKIEILNIESKNALKFIDILVVPSIKEEGFGRVIVEGFFSKTPVIGTEIGAIPELIKDNQTGFLVKPKNYIQIAEKIKYIIENQEKVKEIVENAFKFAFENFTVDRMVEGTLKVYQELIK